MLRFSVFLFIMLVWVVMPQTGYSSSGMTLTLEGSVELAMRQNPEFKIAEKELAKAGADVRGSYSGILPQIDVYANYQHNWKIQENTIPNFIKSMLGPSAPPGMPDFVQIAFGLENTLVYGATVMQPLFVGGASIAGIQAARSAREAMVQNLEITRQELIYQTVDAFYFCLLARELVEVQEEALSQAQANLKMVQKKYAVGMASGFDRMRAEVEVANLKPEAISARNNYQVALTRLKAILGLDRDIEIELSGEFIYTDDDYRERSIQDLQDEAVKNRPEILALDQQENITRKGVTIARSNFLPKLFFTTDYSFLAMRNDLQFRRDDFSEGFYSGINLQIPIFHGFQSSRQYQKARLDVKIMQDTERQARDGITAEVEVAFHKFREAREKYASARETVDLAQEALRLANLMYNEGTNTQLDVLSSQLALTQAKMNYVSSLYQYQISRYLLRKAVGSLDGVI